MRSYEAIYDDFINGRLGKDEWTHEAHLVTCWMALQTHTPGGALAHLRDSIKAHNCGIGIENTDDSGYHETLTVYYVTAIAAIGADDPSVLFEHVRTNRRAPMEFWTKDRLMSTEARHGWLAPDIAPLPWSPVGHETAA